MDDKFELKYKHGILNSPFPKIKVLNNLQKLDIFFEISDSDIILLLQAVLNSGNYSEIFDFVTTISKPSLVSSLNLQNFIISILNPSGIMDIFMKELEKQVNVSNVHFSGNTSFYNKVPNYVSLDLNTLKILSEQYDKCIELPKHFLNL